MTRSNRRGFTLISLLIIMAMIVFVLGLLIPAVVRNRQAASRLHCMGNFKQITLATINCADTYKGNLPPSVGSFPPQDKTFGTMFFHILPFVEQNDLYQQAKGHPSNNGTWSVPIRVFLCPADPSASPDHRFKGWLATSSYAANYLVFKQGGIRFPASFRDGTSNTIMFSERYQVCHGQPTAWGYSAVYTWAPMFMYYNQGKFQSLPNQQHCNPTLTQSPHRDGICVGMADGSVRFVSDHVSPETWYHACTPDGGEPLGNDF